MMSIDSFDEDSNVWAANKKKSLVVNFAIHGKKVIYLLHRSAQNFPISLFNISRLLLQIKTYQDKF